MDQEVGWNDPTNSLFPNRGHRARHCRRPDQLAFLEWTRRGIEARRRACGDRDGFWAKLSARSAPLRLATSEILDAFTHDDGVSVKGGAPSLRFETRDSASMLFRAV